MFIYHHLKRLNALAEGEATRAFKSCFGSERWAAAMVQARPFNLVEDFFATAESAWAALPAGEWLEAFEIEANNSEPTPDTEVDRHRISDLYKQKFGFPLISNSDGSANELLIAWKARFDNFTQTEMRVAANELRQIALSKLNELLEHELAPHADNAAPARG